MATLEEHGEFILWRNEDNMDLDSDGGWSRTNPPSHCPLCGLRLERKDWDFEDHTYENLVCYGRNRLLAWIRRHFDATANGEYVYVMGPFRNGRRQVETQFDRYTGEKVAK